MIDASFSPIKIAKGLIALQKSKKDDENGPVFYVKLNKKTVDVKIHAYATLLGIGAEVSIDVSHDMMTFYVYGNLFNLVAANITVKASYSKLEDADFLVCIEQDL